MGKNQCRERIASGLQGYRGVERSALLPAASSRRRRWRTSGDGQLPQRRPRSTPTRRPIRTQRQPMAAPAGRLGAAQRQPRPTVTAARRQARSDHGAGDKVTVTRAAAQRSREMGTKMYGLFQRAATADGADKSGLTALTYPVMANFAADSAMAVALADTLFFAAASGESKSKVALYLLITIAPVRGDRATDRARTGPVSTRQADRAGRIVRGAYGSRGGADRQLRCRRQFPAVGSLPVRSRNDGVVQVVQRPAKRDDAARVATLDRPGSGQFAADRCSA